MLPVARIRSSFITIESSIQWVNSRQKSKLWWIHWKKYYCVINFIDRRQTCAGFFLAAVEGWEWVDQMALTCRDGRDKQQDEATAQQWTCNERSPRHHLDQEPRQHVRRHLGQSWEQAVQIRVSVHVRSAQTQAKVADGGGEPEKKERKKKHSLWTTAAIAVIVVITL